MRFAAILLLLTSIVSVTIADDGKKPEALSPEQRMEKAFEEYRQLLIEELTPTDWPDDVQTKREKKTATEQKKLEIIELHKSLGIHKDQDAYEKAKANRMRVGKELEKVNKKDRERFYANLKNEGKLEEKQIPKTADDKHLLVIELREATLMESINSPFPKGNKKGPALADPLRTL